MTLKLLSNQIFKLCSSTIQKNLYISSIVNEYRFSRPKRVLNVRFIVDVSSFPIHVS